MMTPSYLDANSSDQPFTTFLEQIRAWEGFQVLLSPLSDRANADPTIAVEPADDPSSINYPLAF